MTPNPDDVPERRLRALGFWPGEIEVERLPGGITNENFRVRCGGRSFVARVVVDMPWLGIDRRNEVVCQELAHSFGVGPALLYQGEGVQVSEFLDARTMGPDDVREPAFVPRLARVLRKLHDGHDEVRGETLYFSAFQTIRTYVATARRFRAPLPVDIVDMLAEARDLERSIGPFVPTLCHNDLLPANILDDGRNVWLVDWEYAGVGHPLFDLACVVATCGFDDDQEGALLDAYYRGPVGPAARRELATLRAASALREALWGAIQSVASGLDFDYKTYTESAFAAYRTMTARRDRPSCEV